MKKIIYVMVETTNPSADMFGYFENEELANAEIDRMKKVIKGNENYYGKLEDISFRQEEIIIDNVLQQ